MNNPPVNGLGYAARKAVAEGVEKAEDDAAVKAIVITGAGKAFCGGADIKEFGSPLAPGQKLSDRVIASPDDQSVVALDPDIPPAARGVAKTWPRPRRRPRWPFPNGGRTRSR